MMCAGSIRFRASLMAMRRTSWIDHRINDGAAMLLFLPWFGVAFFLAAADWHDGGSPPSWRRRASPWTRGDASHARICSRCDRVRTRFWRSQSCPRSPTDGLRPLPAFRWMSPLGRRLISHLRDRPIRHSTNHAAAVLWFRPLPTGVSSRTRAASGRCRRPCQRRIAACPRNGIHERC